MEKETAASSLALIAAALALLAAGATWLDRPQTAPSVSFPPVAQASNATAPVVRPRPLEQTLPDGEVPPADPEIASNAPEHPAEAEPRIPSLEDVVAGITPAVVAIESEEGSGSGFYVRPDTLLTNVHVVGSRSSVTLKRADGTTTTARVERLARQYDIAVLKVSNPLPDQAVLRVGSALNARPGQEVIAVGSALGSLQNTVTRGIVSALRQSGSAMLIQTDAAVNPGNSGGPLLDRNGTVVGITTMGYVERQGLSFAVAIDHAQGVLADRPSSFIAPASSVTGGNLRALSPEIPSARDQGRASGEKLMNQSLAQLAQRADALDDYWRRFRESCYSGRVSGSFSRDWFAVFDPRALPGVVAAGCGSAFEEVKRQAAAIRDAVLAAEEEARRADVYPGVRRDARQKHRFDFPDR
jgi:S1-C subfamily serine protease